ncbi:cytochrome c oxidase subunit 3 [Mucisphaera sp.]|uniref:cytochrome c oxidase subunit 3 n=1 Tax=Mucisphaera sp. TaxID=2913024 RepID=UPI003D125783
MTEASDHGHAHEGEPHHPHLAHHFHTPRQQFESAKLGLWLFMATEVLMFGGLFCAYAIYRGNHKEVYLYSHKFLDTNLGLINTIVLLTSSLTMAWAVRAAMKGQQALLLAMLCLTFAGGCGFMAIKTIEYTSKFDSGLYPGWNNAYYPLDAAASEEAQAARLNKINNYLDRKYLGKYIWGEDYKYKEDPHFYDPHKHHDGEKHADAGEEGQTYAIVPHDGGPTDHAGHDHSPATELAGYVPIEGEEVHHQESGPSEVSLIAPPVEASSATTAAFAQPRSDDHHSHGHARVITFMDLPVEEQNRVHIFYQIYYMMTGLHGIHVLIGMGLMVWLIIRTLGGAFGPDNFTTIEGFGIYWHLVDLIWIFLFPLLYLIH